ncbi:DNA photolyase [Lithospermum erythrorhizon]|uniref:DNA photolyase n=1 Tax=Lithospermum erythrorhizon TaxID=34254 RepID=A0AAV3P8Q7_LITER
MGSSSRTIMWFRRDLRIEDNPALATAAREGSVLALFIWCPKEEGQFYPGRVSRWWLKQSLIHLDKTLRSLGVELKVIKTQSTLSALLESISAVGATKVVYNHLYGNSLSLFAIIKYGVCCFDLLELYGVCSFRILQL